MKDPTANAAARNVDGRKRAAVLNYRNTEGSQRLWLDPATLETFSRMVVEFTDDMGERHIRFNEPTKAWLAEQETAGRVHCADCDVWYLPDDPCDHQKKNARRPCCSTGDGAKAPRKGNQS